MRDRVRSTELLAYGNRGKANRLLTGNFDFRQEKGEGRAAGVDRPHERNRNERAAAISPAQLSTAQTWEAMRETRRLLSALEDPQVEERIFQTLCEIVANILPEQLPPRGEDGLQSLTAPLIAMLPNPAGAVEGVLGAVLNTTAALSPFPILWQQLELNALLASGINPDRPSSKQVVSPTKAKKKGGLEIVADYLASTPLSEYFQTSIPFSIPFSARFEHMHIVGGSGHGKTQLLQSFILRDIEQLHKGRGSVVVIDSQGDMIRTILGLAELSNMTDRVVLIDPNDIENPPCLNLFDFGLDRLEGYDPVEREKLVNGAIALYEYMFGALARRRADPAARGDFPIPCQASDGRAGGDDPYASRVYGKSRDDPAAFAQARSGEPAIF